ncbi:3-deoxy-D-manno-octulosonic acid transferase [Polaromonas sp. CG_23.6]|uniref:3-deoxy-D-manno-octulosonic acid transferase n=1 Tax=Polaromonas sp. CG_23.6 TaxID=2760709 RepID=UPI0024741B0C|nr:3-deoxy-D-manno-octulosonic acid transferase [Polaromonas sp. CG_23.6]MDH6185827.1 3-deoxy-D-manno-octulosonic-acid transferase [Polaromonas sp. CG_23.6]
MSRWARALYSVFTTLVQPLLRRKLARRGRQEPGYLEAVDERFGHYAQPAEAVSELVWVHAVSLGETRTAAMLLKALRKQYPALRLLLTHGTATGREEGRALLKSIGQPGDVQVWQPWDSPAAVARFFSHFKPRLGLLMETEIWPNTVAGSKQRGMPLVLVNGRLSAKSLKQALRLSALSLPAYGALSAVYAQTEGDAGRFHQLGAPVAGVFGNLKFDATPDAAQLEKGRAWRQSLAQPVLMFASSREGEEDEFFKQIKAFAHIPQAQVAMNSVAIPLDCRFKTLVVPRHPQRFDDVAALAALHGLRVSRRSQWTGSPADSAEAMNADVWLGDSLGEMALYYGLADAALLGGSFAPLGGQNLIEAAACGCPVVMGPHTFNFTEAAELAEAEGAALRVADMAEGVQAGLGLAEDPAALAKAVAAGLAFSARNRGATARTVQALREYLQPG